MWMTMFSSMPMRPGIGASAASVALWVCMTPLGSPVVPEVKMSRATSSASGRSAAWWRGALGVAMNCAYAVWPAARSSAASTTITWATDGSCGRSRSIIAG